MANILNDYFATVFVTEDTTNMPSLGDVCSGNCLTEITISIDDVWNQLLALNPSKYGGPDECHPRVLEEVREGIASFATPLYLIFKRSLEEGKVPTAWKDASVTVLHKCGDKSLASNYRPVSLTFVIYKMLEHIIKDHLLHYFNQNNFFTSRQHGFRPFNSCVTHNLSRLWRTGLLYWNLGTKWMLFFLICKRLLIEFRMLG